MINIIPAFISEMLHKGNLHGTISGSSIFVDISGFTSMTEQLMSHGKKGAEVLSGIINRVFSPPIALAREAGGFISTFGGDSFAVVMPEAGVDEASALSRAITSSIMERSRQRTPLGGVEIGVKTGVARGEIEWGILGRKGRRAFYFRGQPVTESALRASLPTDESTPADSGAIAAQGGSPRARVRSSMASEFVPGSVISAKRGGEFRDVVPVFISFEEPAAHEELDRFVSLILDVAGTYGGYVSGLYFEEKGPLMLVLFGAPVSYESNEARAADFSLEVLASSSSSLPCRIGMSQGVVYAGFVGSRSRCTYTALGDTVNTAARLACAIEPGRIALSGGVVRAIRREFALSGDEELVLKGKSRPVRVRYLEERLPSDRRALFDVSMVGREKELRKISRVPARMLETGEFGGFACIYGEAGSGKSLLLDRVLERYRGSCRIALMETDEVLRKSLNPFVYFLRDFFGQKPGQTRQEAREAFDRSMDRLLGRLRSLEHPGAGEIVRELERTRTVLGASLGLEWAGSLYETLDARRRFDNTLVALKEMVRGLSLLRPLILAVEDLQWTDPDTRAAFRVITRNVRDFPFVVLATSRYRDDGSKPSLELDEGVPVLSLELSPLDRERAGELAGNVLGAPPDEDLASEILERCGSNPFYIRQLCLYLQEHGLIIRDGERSSLGGSPKGIPSGVKAILVARLDRLSQKLRDLVQTASVLGREFNVRVLSKMLRGAPIRSVVDSADLSGIWAPLSEIIYIFRHDLMREAAYEMQLGRRVRRLHRLAADAFETLYGGDPEMLQDMAYHYDSAGVAAKAKRYLRRAIDHAEKSYRNAEMLDMLERLAPYYAEASPTRNRISSRIVAVLTRIGEWKWAAELARKTLELATESGQRRMRVDCLNKLGALLNNLGQRDEAAGLLLRAVEESRKRRYYDLLAESLNSLASVRVDQGDYQEGMSLLQRAIEVARKAGAQTLEVQILNNIGRIHCYTGRFDQALEVIEDSATMAESLGLRDSMSTAQYNIGVVKYHLGRREEGLVAFEKMLEAAREIGDKRSIGIAVGSIGSVYAERGDHDTALECQYEKLRMAREMDDKVMMLYALGNIGLSHYYKERYDEALVYYTEYVEIAEATGSKAELCNIYGHIGNIHAKLLDYGLAQEYYDRMYELAERIGDPEHRLQAIRYSSWIKQEHGAMEQARSMLRDCLREAREMDSMAEVLATLGTIAGLEAQADNHPEAIAYAEEGLAIARELQDTPEISANLAVLASSCFETGRLEDAERYVDEAIRTSEEASSIASLWSSRLLKARLVAREDHDRALRMLEELETGTGQPEREAELRATMYEIGGSETDRKKALSIYRELYDRTTSVRYEACVGRLSGTG